MKNKVHFLLIALTSLVGVHIAAAQGTTFTYQGRLSNGGAAANGLYDFRFRLYTDPAGSFQVGSNYLTNAVPTTNGLFTVPIDFGAGIFTGTTTWLEVGVRTNGVGTYTVLNPLQRLTPTPYAIFAETASTLSGVLPAAQLSGPVGAANLSGTYGNAVNLNNAGNNFSGSFNGNGGGLTNLNAWALTGNSNTAPGVNFLGTADNQPLEIRVNNQRALQLVPTTNTANFIGGDSNNFVAPGIYGATIGGGGTLAYSGGSGLTNKILGNFATIGGGVGNTASGTVNDPTGDSATVGGGWRNSALGNNGVVSGGDENYNHGDNAVIAGGAINTNFANFGTIGGGYYNIIQSNSTYSLIGGGYRNQIYSNAPAATISGGYQNQIQPGSQVSTIGGGYNNLIGTNSHEATIGGGYFNQVTNSYATVPGGYNNMAGGLYSFAAGYRAQALHQGSFVLADSSGSYFDSTTNNEFSIRAQNGVRIQSDTGIHLNAGDEPLIVRDWDVFATNAPSYKAGIGRWGLFMEYSSLTIGIPGDDLFGRTFQVAKYNTNGTPTILMLVDQAGNVTANSFNASGGGSFSGNGSALTSVNAATLNGFSSSSFAPDSGSGNYIQNQTAVSQAASFNISGNANIGGTARITSLTRSGSETGTAETPSPAGLVVRRINSAGAASNNIVAVAGTAYSTIFTLVRDGSGAGFQVKAPASAGHLAIACMGIDATGAQKNFYTNVLLGAAATFQIYSNAQNIVHFECTFGDPYFPSHLTQVTLTRWGTDSFWMGNVNSTYNQ